MTTPCHQQAQKSWGLLQVQWSDLHFLESSWLPHEECFLRSKSINQIPENIMNLPPDWIIGISSAPGIALHSSQVIIWLLSGQKRRYFTSCIWQTGNGGLVWPVVKGWESERHRSEPTWLQALSSHVPQHGIECELHR